MSKWLEDLLLNIEIWLYRRLRKLLQHGGTDFAVSLDTLYAELAQKEQYRDGVYLHLKERLEGTEDKPLSEGVPVRPLPATQDLAHLQAAVELLGERKIEDASPAIPDGVSFLRCILDRAVTDTITELIDTNKGWTWDKSRAIPFSYFPHVHKIILGCSLQNDGHMFDGNLTQLGEEIEVPELVQIKSTGNWTQSVVRNNSTIKVLRIPKLKYMTNEIGVEQDSNSKILAYECSNLEEIYAPSLEEFCSNINGAGGVASGAPKLRKVIVGNIRLWFCRAAGPYFFDNYRGTTYNNIIHLEFASLSTSLKLNNWTAQMSLRTDTTASDYIDLREDKDEQGEFINATNLEQFLANFRKYIILRVANRTGQTALTLTLSAAVYQSIYGLDSSNNADNSSWARTHTLADLGLTEADLTEAEQAAGITVNTIYATWLDTYRSAINWNIGH